MEINKIHISSLKELQKFAKMFYKTLKGGEVVLLVGDLGAGKTTFTKSFCKCAKVKEEVTSPTFTIMKEYQGKTKKIVHFDLYRIENESEVQEFGFEEYVYQNTNDQFVLIEWPYNLKNFEYPRCIQITIDKINEQERMIEIRR